MFAAYRRLLALPGALAFTLAGLLARLSASMGGVSVVVMISERRGSYALAGAVTASGLVTLAIGMPLLGRLVDRYGQARVAVPAVLAAGVPITGLLLCVRLGAPDWTLFLCWAASSVVPNLGGMVRARWAHLLPGDERLHLANSLEQALDELCFMTGPVLAVLLCGALFPEAGLLASGLFCVTGVLLLAVQRGTEPPPSPRVDPTGPVGRRGKAVPAGLWVLVPVFLCSGVVFGSMEVTTIAWTDAHGVRPLGGLLLGLVAAGSCVSGLAFGLLPVRRSPVVRLVGGVAAMAVLLLLPLAVGLSGAGPVLLAPALFLAGSGTAPTMVSGMTLVQQLLPAGRLNEGMAAAVSAILVGISAGSALGGAVAERAAAGTGYLVPAAAAATALLIAASGLRLLRGGPAAAPAAAGHPAGEPAEMDAPAVGAAR
ncbi:MFS transporter [Kitasatospora sp. NPDC051914]|uniref:MFS transporter n=1 Tax=Kitasatospora sp. NPDC051914 TaxID=3154945 RepID=UPI0034247DA6